MGGGLGYEWAQSGGHGQNGRHIPMVMPFSLLRCEDEEWDGFIALLSPPLIVIFFFF